MRNKLFLCCLLILFSARGWAQAQTPAATPWSWEQVRQRFEENNPTLLAGKLSIDESKAQEITAYLRPNPSLSWSQDQILPIKQGSDCPPTVMTKCHVFSNLLSIATVSYLYERANKRELRLESAQGATAVATSGQADLERSLLFNLRGAFVQTLQAKVVLAETKENLDYYDRVLQVSSERFKTGDIAQIDLDRLQLQRVQYESDLQTAEVNLRTAKIQLLMLLNDRTPIDEFDVTGPFGFSDQLLSLDEFRNIALDTRPDLRAAVQVVDKAKSDYQLAIANSYADPTFGFDVGRNPPFQQYFGVSMSIPLRIFDRNQGEILRTHLDIDRNQKLLDAAQARVFSDVDSAYETLKSNLILLQPYQTKYLPQAVKVRDGITFSYQRGGASLLDFLNAQNDYRRIELSYINLVGSYLMAVNQLNLAVGREAIP
jgi:outer membrane protein, heavy metal efflux system